MSKDNRRQNKTEKQKPVKKKKHEKDWVKKLFEEDENAEIITKKM